MSMQFHVITIFPNLVEPYLTDSIIGRAIKEKKIKVTTYNPRMFVKGKYKKIWPDGNISTQVDDRPYGGGPGMVMRAEPIIDTVASILKKISKRSNTKVKIINFAPSGKHFSTAYAKNTSKKYTDIILICGRYEGIDSRVDKILKTEKISIGEYVLTGGELPALVVIDCIARQIPGVLGNFNSREEERVASKEFYTRPEEIVYKGKRFKVPPVLLSGHHEKMEAWKKKKRSN